MNTGNNLLFLLLGAMLGSIVLSSWLSEQVIRNIEVRRHTPRGVPVGTPARVTYEVLKHGGRIPSLSLEIHEAGLPGAAFVNRLDAGETRVVRREHRFVRRGVYPLEVITLSTVFPFGLFRKERDLRRAGELVIWPRTDRPVPAVSAGTERGGRTRPARRGEAGARGEYRGLRGYRAGDDPRDIHWRSTARLGEPVIREYERDGSPGAWICLDLREADEERAERTVEIAASLAARLQKEGRRFGLHTARGQVEPGEGSRQLERVLDFLARVEFDARAPTVSPPSDPARCILVSSSARAAGEFGEVLLGSRRRSRSSAATTQAGAGPADGDVGERA